jgi:hypothetical protein
MSQDDTPDLATPQAGKVAPEAVALRAQPRPVTRLNRRTLAILVGGLSVAVLGATIWSLQPQRRGRASRPSFTTSIASRSPKGWMACRPTTRSCRRRCPSWGRRCRAILARPS